MPGQAARMTNTDTAAPIALSPAGAYVSTIETGRPETTVTQTFRSHRVDEARVIVRDRRGIAWRLDRVDAGETDGRLVLVFIRQRKTGGDYARRVQTWATDRSIDELGTASERALLARVRATFAATAEAEPARACPTCPAGEGEPCRPGCVNLDIVAAEVDEAHVAEALPAFVRWHVAAVQRGLAWDRAAEAVAEDLVAMGADRDFVLAVASAFDGLQAEELVAMAAAG
jgi:hypothetical protein